MASGSETSEAFSITPDLVRKLSGALPAKEKESVLKLAGSKLTGLFDKAVAKALASYTEKEYQRGEVLERAVGNEQRLHEIVSHDVLFQRLQGSRNVALWYLLQSPGFEDEIKKTLKAKDKETDALGVYHQVISSYLKSIEKRSEEEKFFKNPYLPTIGIEIEFRRKSLVADENLRKDLKQKFGKDRFQDHLDYPSKMILSGGVDYGRDVDVLEVRSRPAASPRTTLREIYQLIKAGKLQSEDLGIHTTVAGIGLDGENLEPTELTSLAVGTGYGGPYFTGDLFHLVKSGEIDPFIINQHEKDYFQGHKRRSDYFIEIYKPLSSGNGVEFRTCSGRSDFVGLVKNLETHFWFSAAIMAKQHQRKTRQGQENEVETQLADIWDEFGKEWRSKLSARGIIFRNDPDAFRTSKTTAEEDKFYKPEYRISKTEYTTMLGKIGLLSQTDSDFRKECREIAIKYRAKIKEVLGLRGNKADEGEASRATRSRSG